MNCPETHHACKIYDKLNDLFLNQKRLEPTRFRDGVTPSNLTRVLCDVEKLIEDVVLLPPVRSSNHTVIRFQIDMSYDEPDNIPRYQYHKEYSAKYEGKNSAGKVEEVFKIKMFNKFKSSFKI